METTQQSETNERDKVSEKYKTFVNASLPYRKGI